MSKRTHHVEIQHEGLGGRVVVNGMDISSTVRGLKWESEVGSVPRMTLDLRLFDVTTVGSPETEIFLPTETRDALIALGWTPPDSHTT